MIKNSPHLIQMGRRSTCIMPDLINKGIGLLDKGMWDGSEDSSGERPRAMTLEDIAVELNI